MSLIRDNRGFPVKIQCDNCGNYENLAGVNPYTASDGYLEYRVLREIDEQRERYASDSPRAVQDTFSHACSACREEKYILELTERLPIRG